MPKLFDPLNLKGVQLPNRIAPPRWSARPRRAHVPGGADAL
jgi:2,4-dienoyl-CoA reductase-like NADH-dependent reductase (Old Yellow Enzyme family)